MSQIYHAGIYIDKDNVAVALLSVSKNDYFSLERLELTKPSFRQLGDILNALAKGYQISKININKFTPLEKFLSNGYSYQIIDTNLEESIFAIRALIQDDKLLIHQDLREGMADILQYFNPDKANHELRAMSLAMHDLRYWEIEFESIGKRESYSFEEDPNRRLPRLPGMQPRDRFEGF